MLGPHGGTDSPPAVLYLLGGRASSVGDWCEMHADVLQQVGGDRFAVLFDVDETADLGVLPFDEVWAIGDLIAAGGIAQFIVEFLAARSVTVVHVAGTRLGVDLIPTLRYAFGSLEFAVSLPSGTDASVFSRYVACRYFNLVHEFLVDDQETATLLQSLSVPTTSMLMAPDRPPRSPEVTPSASKEHRTYRDMLTGAGWREP